MYLTWKKGVYFVNFKKKLSISLAIIDILVIVLVVFVKSNVSVNNVEKKDTVAAANVLTTSDDALDIYRDKEIEEYIESRPVIVYDNLTMDELAAKLDNVLHSTMSGKGYLVASYALEQGVDPYLATAVILLETGCNSSCSSMVNTCHNVGGQKGSGCGAYASFPTLDDGIRAFIDNLNRNYFSRGLNTPESIGPKYAESGEWPRKVNNYINQIKNA